MAADIAFDAADLTKPNMGNIAGNTNLTTWHIPRHLTS